MTVMLMTMRKNEWCTGVVMLLMLVVTSSVHADGVVVREGEDAKGGKNAGGDGDSKGGVS